MIEFAQMGAKKLKGRFRSYFTIQNMTEVLIMMSTVAFLHFAPNDIERGGHIGGWLLFFAWINFTTYLCQVSSFGRAIYSSLYVTKKIGSSLVIFIPSLVGFTAGFHLFLNGNDNFHDFFRAYLKVLVMMLGEYDYEDNFSYSMGLEVGGRNFSLQVYKIFDFGQPNFSIYFNHRSLAAEILTKKINCFDLVRSSLNQNGQNRIPGPPSHGFSAPHFLGLEYKSCPNLLILAPKYLIDTLCIPTKFQLSSCSQL